MRRLTFGSIRIKDPFSALSHALAMPLALAALVVLVTFASLEATAWHVVSFAIFGTTMFMVYLASTLYHWLPLTASQERLFRRIDQSAVYLLIAGTYTPIALVAIRGSWGWTLFGLTWVLASLGILSQWWRRSRKAQQTRLHAAIYLSLGWVCVAFLTPIVRALSTQALIWLVLGGVSYTFGAVVYALKRPNLIPGVVEAHEVFHVFVLIGSFCHFWLMFKYVLPMNGLGLG